MKLTDTDRQYRSLCNRIGAALLMFYAIFNTLSAGIVTGQQVLLMFIPSDFIDTVLSLAYYGSYLFAFMFPVLFFKLISKNHSFPNMKLNFRLSPAIFLLIPAAVGVNFLVAEINSLLLLPINFNILFSQDAPESYHLYNFILDTIGTAMVPAFCEEFLFRGLILFALLPYGKKTAIYGSAILFAFMHQNPGQFLYTFVLGIILAYMAIESDSIWGGILLHFVNNFLSVGLTALVYVLPEDVGMIVYYVLFYGIMIVGLLIAFGLLLYHVIRRAKRKKKKKALVAAMPNAYGDGLIGVNALPYDDEQDGFKISKKSARRGFFAPLNLIFMLLAIGNMIMLIIMAILMNLGELWTTIMNTYI